MNEKCDFIGNTKNYQNITCPIFMPSIKFKRKSQLTLISSSCIIEVITIQMQSNNAVAMGLSLTGPVIVSSLHIEYVWNIIHVIDIPVIHV